MRKEEEFGWLAKQVRCILDMDWFGYRYQNRTKIEQEISLSGKAKRRMVCVNWILVYFNVDTDKTMIKRRKIQVMIGEPFRRMVCVGGERPARWAALWSNMDPPWVALASQYDHDYDDDDGCFGKHVDDHGWHWLLRILMMMTVQWKVDVKHVDDEDEERGEGQLFSQIWTHPGWQWPLNMMMRRRKSKWLYNRKLLLARWNMSMIMMRMTKREERDR